MASWKDRLGLNSALFKKWGWWIVGVPVLGGMMYFNNKKRTELTQRHEQKALEQERQERERLERLLENNPRAKESIQQLRALEKNK